MFVIADKVDLDNYDGRIIITVKVNQDLTAGVSDATEDWRVDIKDLVAGHLTDGPLFIALGEGADFALIGGDYDELKKFAEDEDFWLDSKPDIRKMQSVDKLMPVKVTF